MHAHSKALNGAPSSPQRVRRWGNSVVALPIAMAALALLASCNRVAPSDGSGRRLSAREVYERAHPSVVTLTIQGRDGSSALGTGFLAISPGIVVTAAHVVAGGVAGTARFATGEESQITGIVDVNGPADIALLRISSVDHPLLRLASLPPAIGERVYTIGAPRGLDFSVSDGLVSQQRNSEGIQFIQFTAPASPGDSGGPLLNEGSEVVAVISRQMTEGQNLNFAVAAGHVAQLDAHLTAAAWTHDPGDAGAGAARSALSDFARAFVDSVGTWTKGELLVENAAKTAPATGWASHMLTAVSTAKQSWRDAQAPLAPFANHSDVRIAECVKRTTEFYARVSWFYDDWTRRLTTETGGDAGSAADEFRSPILVRPHLTEAYSNSMQTFVSVVFAEPSSTPAILRLTRADRLDLAARLSSIPGAASGNPAPETAASIVASALWQSMNRSLGSDER